MSMIKDSRRLCAYSSKMDAQPYMSAKKETIKTKSGMHYTRYMTVAEKEEKDRFNFGLFMVGAFITTVVLYVWYLS